MSRKLNNSVDVVFGLVDFAAKAAMAFAAILIVSLCVIGVARQAQGAAYVGDVHFVSDQPTEYRYVLRGYCDEDDAAGRARVLEAYKTNDWDAYIDTTLDTATTCADNMVTGDPLQAVKFVHITGDSFIRDGTCFQEAIFETGSGRRLSSIISCEKLPPSVPIPKPKPGRKV